MEKSVIPWILHIAAEGIKSTRRAMFLGLLLAAMFFNGTPPALAAEYPNAPVRVIVGFPPGNATDTVARALAEKLSGKFGGTPFIVENRPGAAGSIGTSAVAKAEPNGLTLLVGSNGTLAINPWLYKDLSYNSVKDFAPITQLVSLPMYLVVHPSVPADNLAELVALAKEKPGELTYGSSGNGSANHLAVAVLAAATGMDLMHIPYKGSAPALTDLLAGRLTLMVDTAPAVLQQIQAGKVKVLAVTKPTRTAVLPQVPSVAESGYPGFDAQAWLGFAAPAGTPQATLDVLAKASTEILQSEPFKEKMTQVGAEPVGSTPKEFGAYIASELQRWGDVIKKNRIEKQ